MSVLVSFVVVVMILSAMMVLVVVVLVPEGVVGNENETAATGRRS